jgi:bacteriorhodopsin
MSFCGHTLVTAVLQVGAVVVRSSSKYKYHCMCCCAVVIVLAIREIVMSLFSVARCESYFENVNTVRSISTFKDIYI